MKAETWFTAAGSPRRGLHRRDRWPERRQASFDLSVFNHAPAALAGREESAPGARELERALRDAGCSRAVAKAILAGGLKAGDAAVQTTSTAPRGRSRAPRRIPVLTRFPSHEGTHATLPRQSYCERSEASSAPAGRAAPDFFGSGSAGVCGLADGMLRRRSRRDLRALLLPLLVTLAIASCSSRCRCSTSTAKLRCSAASRPGTTAR
jgi:hypothetical protein